MTLISLSLSSFLSLSLSLSFFLSCVLSFYLSLHFSFSHSPSLPFFLIPIFFYPFIYPTDCVSIYWFYISQGRTTEPGDDHCEGEGLRRQQLEDSGPAPELILCLPAKGKYQSLKISIIRKKSNQNVSIEMSLKVKLLLFFRCQFLSETILSVVTVEMFHDY